MGEAGRGAFAPQHHTCDSPHASRMLSFGSFSSYLYLVTAPRRRLQLGRARAVALRRACPYEDDVCRCAANFSINAEDRAAAAAEFWRRRRVLARLPQLGEEDSSFAGTLHTDPQREEQQEQLQQRKRARSAPVPAPAPAASGKRPAPPGDANKPPGKRAAPPPGEVIDLCDSD